jgi:hypothetical protein
MALLSRNRWMRASLARRMCSMASFSSSPAWRPAMASTMRPARARSGAAARGLEGGAAEAAHGVLHEGQEALQVLVAGGLPDDPVELQAERDHLVDLAGGARRLEAGLGVAQPGGQLVAGALGRQARRQALEVLAHRRGQRLRPAGLLALRAGPVRRRQDGGRLQPPR